MITTFKRLTYLLAMCAFMAMAQEQSETPPFRLPHNPHSIEMPGMDHAAPLPIIDGSKDPNQIPDLVAYRLYFITVGELPGSSEVQQKRQRAFISKVPGFSEDDPNALIRVLETFKVDFSAMVQDYNVKVDAANRTGSPLPDSQAFLQGRDQLVQQTRDRLKQVLSPNGMAGLDAHVKAEKSRMTITAHTSQEVSQ